MASKTGLTTITVFLLVNTVFISLASATNNNPHHATTCPIDALKLRVCANLLNGLLGIKIGGPPTPSAPCCSLIQGLADVEAATCVCTALRANVLGIIHLNVPLSLSLLLNKCGCKLPSGFTCP